MGISNPEIVSTSSCNDPATFDALTAYAFGDELTEVPRQQVDSHIGRCARCAEELMRLEACVRALRYDPNLVSLTPTPEIVSVLGMSGRLDTPFGGHRLLAVGVSVLYGLLWAVGIWSELGYAYDRFGTLTWWLSVPTAGMVAALLLFALSDSTNATRSGSSRGPVQSVVILSIGFALLTAILVLALPDERTILASFQTRTAAGGYLKDVIVIFLPLLVFVAPTFHTVLRLQRELGDGRYKGVLDLLGRKPESVSPKGVIYLGPASLAFLFLVLAIIKVLGANHMLDALTPGPYANLFTIASYISTGLWLAIGVISIGWYATTLNELKREALVLARLQENAR